MPDRDVTYEYDVDPDATNNTAATILRLVRETEGAVLDLGSGPGVVASLLASDGRHVTCVDADAELLELARERGVEHTVVADLEDPAWVTAVPQGPFGAIILADVLEHLREPERVLAAIRDHGLLGEDGSLVISVPNIAHEAVIAGLLGGRFDYTDTGLLDATHIRFFTHDSLHSLLEEAGFVVTRLHRTTRTLEQTEQFSQVDFIDTPLREAMRDHVRELRTYQFIVRAEPRDLAHQLALLREQAQMARQERIRRLEDARVAHEERMASLKADHATERERLEQRRALVETALTDAEERLAERDEVIAAQSADIVALRVEKDREVEAARERIAALESERNALERDRDALRQNRDEQDSARQRLQREVDRLQSKVDAVYESETWKVGRAVTWPLRAVTGRSSRAGRSRERSSRGRSADGDDRPHRRHHRVVSPFELAEDLDGRARYQRAIDHRDFEREDAVHVLVTVSTRDLAAGRGDLFTAVGLGLALEAEGYEFVYATEEDWYSPPESTDVVLSLLAEPTLMLDPAKVPSQYRLVAWIRNNTTRWASSPSLGLYDAILCSSEATLREIRDVYSGPTSILRIGVDADLFSPSSATRAHAVTTVNQWGRERATYAALRQAPIDFPLAIYGTQRQFSDELEPYRQGPASYFSLPSLYAQAAVVLDDQQEVNRPYGNVNSRIFESLAVGALPVSNTAVGSALHLEELPVYDTPEQLHALVTYYLEQPAARSELVRTLQAKVLEHHTYHHRAQEFHGFMQDSGVLGESWTPSSVMTFQPDYRATNPYQELLYQSLGDMAVVPVNAPGAILASPRLSGRRGVHHVHWTATVLGPAESRRDADTRCSTFLDQLDQLIAKGWRVIWTIHNDMPHECRYPEAERRLRQGLADRAAAIHVMCERTVDLVRDHYILPPDRVRVIPHGSYLDVYPRLVDRSEARRRLDLDGDASIVLFFGQIRPYKGLERLLDAFEEARRRVPELQLLVAGSLGRFEGVQPLADRILATEGVAARLEAVPDDEVQLYLAAADAVVLPHERVLNSGGALLAWSFGRAVIAPRVGCLQDLVTDDVGVLFEPDGDGLATALANTPGLAAEPVQAAARRRAEEWTHRAMADAFHDVVTELDAATSTV